MTDIDELIERLGDANTLLATLVLSPKRLRDAISKGVLDEAISIQVATITALTDMKAAKAHGITILEETK